MKLHRGFIMLDLPLEICRIVSEFVLLCEDINLFIHRFIMNRSLNQNILFGACQEERLRIMEIFRISKFLSARKLFGRVALMSNPNYWLMAQFFIFFGFPSCFILQGFFG
jgi:hypothetical protein